MVAAAPPDVSPCLPPSRRAQTRRLDCHTAPGRRYEPMEHCSSGPGPASPGAATRPAPLHSIARAFAMDPTPRRIDLPDWPARLASPNGPEWSARLVTDERSPRKRCWRGLREAWAGIEPAYRAFAELCLTTWLPGRKRWAALLTKIQAPGKRLSRCGACLDSIRIRRSGRCQKSAAGPARPELQRPGHQRPAAGPQLRGRRAGRRRSS